MTWSRPALSLPTESPRALESEKLIECARARGLLLALDYDGTLADISAEPERAFPRPGVREELSRLLAVESRLQLAIITGRRIEEVQRLLGIDQGLYFSGLHGLERCAPDGRIVVPAALAAFRPELDRLRMWLQSNVPRDRGFWIEDKGFALGLHYRLADPAEAAALATKFETFATTEAPRLRLMRLKMLIEAAPPVASKGSALLALKQAAPPIYVAAYFGDDTTDEDAFAALASDDFAVLVGPSRPTRARYRVDSPAAMVTVLHRLADALA